jgi:hypothetical protein
MSESLRFDREEIIFKNKGNVNRLYSKLILKNSSENYIGYQIKGNNVKRYIISKPLGKIKPYSTLEVNIEMTLNDRDLEKVDSISDKFCCFYMHIDEEDADKSESELQSILKTKKKNKTIHKLKIRSRVGTNTETREETPIFEQVLRPGNTEDPEQMEEVEEVKEEEVKMGFNAKKTMYSGGFQTPSDVGRLKDSMDVDSEMKKIMGKVESKLDGVDVKSCIQVPVVLKRKQPLETSVKVTKDSLENMVKSTLPSEKNVVKETIKIAKKNIVQVFEKIIIY